MESECFPIAFIYSEYRANTLASSTNTTKPTTTIIMIYLRARVDPFGASVGVSVGGYAMTGAVEVTEDTAKDIKETDNKRLVKVSNLL